jgi:choline dehydrogenase-like flavoprotein
LKEYENIAGMWLVSEDMPQTTNRVTLHPTEKDQFGMPIPNIHCDDHANDIAMRNHAYKRGAMVYEAVGATRIIRIPPGISTRNLGTCRQSARREDGVCNKWGQAHDVKNLFISDGSQFTTGAAAKSDTDDCRPRYSSSGVHCRPNRKATLGETSL